jgi:hypothetical protein
MTKLYHHILTCGTYLSTRVEGNEVIHLYAVDGLMVEVYFDPDNQNIHRIEVVGDYQIRDIWDFSDLPLN